MMRLDYLLVMVGVASGGMLLTLTHNGQDRFVGVFIIVGTIATLIGLNHQLPRKPELVVRYENRDSDDGPVPVIFRDRKPGGGTGGLNVVLYNKGPGNAESIEVRFDATGASHLYNETGNEPDPFYLNKTVQPPHFTGHDRSLPSEEQWILAYLTFRPFPGEEWTPPHMLHWEAYAKRMTTQRGTVEIEIR